MRPLSIASHRVQRSMMSPLAVTATLDLPIAHRPLLPFPPLGRICGPLPAARAGGAAARFATLCGRHRGCPREITRLGPTCGSANRRGLSSSQLSTLPSKTRSGLSAKTLRSVPPVQFPGPPASSTAAWPIGTPRTSGEIPSALLALNRGESVVAGTCPWHGMVSTHRTTSSRYAKDMATPRIALRQLRIGPPLLVRKSGDLGRALACAATGGNVRRDRSSAGKLPSCAH